MIDNLFTIKRASEMLECTTQNLYGKQDKLKELGYWEKSDTGRNYITKEGINHLQNKRIETMQSSSKGFKQLENNNLQSIANAEIPGESTNLVDILQEQIKELKEEKEYWRKQTEIKDQELKNKNDYIQELNTKAFALLGTAEDNQKQEEKNKKGIFKWFFK